MAKSTETAKAPKSARKPAAAKSGAAKTTRAAKPATDEATTPETSVTLKSRTLLDRVTQRSGAKRSVAKTVIEAVLAELGESLSRGESFSLPPLGRARVGRSATGAKGETIVVKLRRASTEKIAESPLASADA